MLNDTFCNQWCCYEMTVIFTLSCGNSGNCEMWKLASGTSRPTRLTHRCRKYQTSVYIHNLPCNYGRFSYPATYCQFDISITILIFEYYPLRYPLGTWLEFFKTEVIGYHREHLLLLSVYVKSNSLWTSRLTEPCTAVTDHNQTARHHLQLHTGCSIAYGYPA